MEYNFHGFNRDDIEHWALVCLSTMAYNDNGLPDGFDAARIDVTLTYNGVELDVMELARRIHDHTEQWAAQVAREHINDIGRGIEEDIDAIRAKLRTAYSEKFGVLIEEDW